LRTGNVQALQICRARQSANPTPPSCSASARTVHLDSILKGELAENEFRKDFTHSERAAIGEAIEIELQGRNHRPASESPENFPDLPKGDTRDIAAKAAGFGNGKTYEQAKKVTNEAAPELVQVTIRRDTCHTEMGGQATYPEKGACSDRQNRLGFC
jgi:hypothetical protein